MLQNALQVALVIALVPNIDHPEQGLGIAYAVAYTAAAVVALVVLHRRVGGVIGAGSVRSSCGCAVASTAAAAASAAVVSATGVDDEARLVELAVGLPVAAGVFVATAFALRVTEITQLVAAVSSRRGKG